MSALKIGSRVKFINTTQEYLGKYAVVLDFQDARVKVQMGQIKILCHPEQLEEVPEYYDNIIEVDFVNKRRVL